MAGAGQGVVIPSGARGLSGTGAVRLFNSNGFCPECDCEDGGGPTVMCSYCISNLAPERVRVTISGAVNCNFCYVTPGVFSVARSINGDAVNGSYLLTWTGNATNCGWSFLSGIRHRIDVFVPGGCPNGQVLQSIFGTGFGVSVDISRVNATEIELFVGVSGDWEFGASVRSGWPINCSGTLLAAGCSGFSNSDCRPSSTGATGGPTNHRENECTGINFTVEAA